MTPSAETQMSHVVISPATEYPNSQEDLISALQNLGTKYNRLMNKCKEQASELEALRANAETLSKKCIQECEPKYEILKQKYTKECSERNRLFKSLHDKIKDVEQDCKNYQMKIKDQESQVADEKNSRVPQETKELSKYFKLMPRLPLGGITNRMPSSGPTSKYFSPPSLGSPRQKLRSVSSPGSSSSSMQMQKKPCNSVQKKVLVGLPARLKQQPIAVRDREVVGRFGKAQRVLCNKN